MTSRRSSGSIRADSAVEPTKSENITVTWRRSADADAASVAAPGLLTLVSCWVSFAIRSDEETNDADHRNFYKVEKWTKDCTKVDRMLFAGSDLDKAREVFAAAIKH